MKTRSTSTRSSNVKRILEEVNDHFLDIIVADNLNAKPDPADINCGLCDQWAEEALHRLTEAGLDNGASDCIWIEDQGKEWENFAHCVLFFNGKYYDSETLDGADSINGIKMVKNYNKKIKSLKLVLGE